MSVESDMKQLLLNMEVWLSYGTIVNWSPSKAPSCKHPGGNLPPGEEWPAHIEWRMRWDNAKDKDHCYGQAVDAYALMRKQKEVEVVAETLIELEARVLKVGKGWPVDEVARECRCTQKQVRKARENAKVSLLDGTDIVERGMAFTERKSRIAKAKEMQERGLTLKQIGLHLGRDAATISRDLQYAAKAAI